MDDWVQAARRAFAAGQPAALISVLGVEGSAPRGPGTRMLVTDEEISGTIGGGALELQAIRQARQALAHEPGTWRIQDYPLGPLLGQCCGGRVRLLIEHLDAGECGWIGGEGVLATRFADGAVSRRLIQGPQSVSALPARGPAPQAGDEIVERLGQRTLPVMLFGAGHVGRAVARAVETLPVRLAWFDSREAEAATPGVALVEQDQLPTCVADATPETAVLIMSHDHALDYQLTVAALGSNAGFVGLIGSATKRARFLSRLQRDGVDSRRLTCPIGVEGVKGKDPAIIAVSVAAQLMQLYGVAG